MCQTGEEHSRKHLEQMRENQALRQRIAEMEDKLELSDLVFEHIENGALVTDPQGKIIRFNRPYADFVEKKPSDMIGCDVTEVIENTRMHIVAQTGKPESMLIQRIRGKDLVVQRIPIKKNGKVMAVFGQIMFKDLREIHSLAKTLELMESRVRLYEEELTALRRARYTLQSIKGTSQKMNRLRHEAEQAGGHSLPVLITGESGTGKEVFAQAIHNASHRRHNPFVRINCAAIPHDLFESELFGYAKGAFTGALSQGKPGKFELAGAGTIFLDEIGEMPLEMQPKLLQVLEEKVFERVGGVKPMRTQCRIMAATNRNLENMMADSSFRKDLFFRLNVVPIHIRPLRERREDILPIAVHLLEQIAQDFGQVRYSIEEEASAILKAYDWPGNVRELHNVLERTLSLMKGTHIRAENLPLYLRKQPNLPATADNWNLRSLVGQTEKKVLAEALAYTGNNKAQTARLLGIDRTVLYRKMKKYNIAY